MRKLFFIAVSCLLVMPTFADPGQVLGGTDGIPAATTVDIGVDVKPWTEITFNQDVAMTMASDNTRHAAGATVLYAWTNHDVWAKIEGTDLVGPGGAMSFGGYRAADGSTPASVGKWDALFENGTHVQPIAMGTGHTPAFPIALTADATTSWWDLWVGNYAGTLTVTITDGTP